MHFSRWYLHPFYFEKKAILIGPGSLAGGQDSGMAMPMDTLLGAKQVVPQSSSNMTGTGAFLLDVARQTMAYNLTYCGLASDRTKSITLSNFGRGANGATVGERQGS